MTMILAGSAAGLLLLSTAATAGLVEPPPDRGDWQHAGDLATPRSGHTATVLPDGTVVVIGGQQRPSKGKARAIGSIETWRP